MLNVVSKNINTSEDATWEALILDRIIEPANPPEVWCGASGYDYCWKTTADTQVKYNAGWCGQGRRGGIQIAYYNKDGVRHRLYGPAIVNKPYRTELWLKEGYFHREDEGPAYIHGDTQKWYYDGKLHRLGGPAIISKGQPKEYWINGQKLSPKEYKKELNRRIQKGLYVPRK